MPGRTSPPRTFARFPAAGRPVLVMMSGLPGSGKSFVGRQIARDLPAVIVENDSLRRKLFEQRKYSDAENRQVYRAAANRIREAVQVGDDIVFDATNLTEAARKGILKLAE